MLDVRSTGLSTTYDRTLFGQKADSPFRDERVRQAYVLTWDRDLFIDAAYSTAQFTKAGIEMERAYDGAIAATTYEGWWLDPKARTSAPTPSTSSTTWPRRRSCSLPPVSPTV